MSGRSPMSEDYYAQVNELWKTITLPPITATEALRAARKLARHFGGGLPTYVRRCWTTSRPRGVYHGWPRLVHDVSHRTHRRIWPGTPDHSSVHADLERRMIEYVVTSGWLEPKPRPAPIDRVLLRSAHAERMLGRAERRLKLAATVAKRWRRKVAYYSRRAA